MIDRYTKMIVTLIAASLVAPAGQNVTKPAFAQHAGPVHVVVDQIQVNLATLSLPVHAQ